MAGWDKKLKFAAFEKLLNLATFIKASICLKSIKDSPLRWQLYLSNISPINYTFI